jgi:uncharacterized repeat protein (TIGR01451 family)
MNLSKLSLFIRPAVMLLSIGAVLLIGAGSAVWATASQPDYLHGGGGTVPRREADLAISMSGAKNGNVVTVRISVKNNGQIVSENAVVRGSLPSNLKYAATQGKCKIRQSDLTCTLGNLSAGTAVNLTITGTLNTKAGSKSMKASASVNARTRDPDNSNNKANVTIQ